MKVQINTDNFFVLIGNIISVHTYGADNKSANVVIGMNDPEDGVKNIKYFNQSMFSTLKPGMPVVAIGRIGSNSYIDKKTGERKYKDNNDIIAEAIKILESKSQSQQRIIEAMYAAAVDYGTADASSDAQSE